MGRHATWLVLGALALLAAAAAIDSLRADEPASRSADARPAAQADASTRRMPPHFEDRRAVAAEVRQEGVRGALFFTDDLCRVWRLRLTDLELRRRPEATCRLSYAPSGDLVFAAPRRGDPVPRPGGRLSVPWEGQVVELTPKCRTRGVWVFAWGEARCGRVVLSHADVMKALDHHPNVPDDPRLVHDLAIKDIGWLGPSRLAAIVAAEIAHGPRVEAVVVFEGRNVVSVSAGFGAPFLDLEVSPRRSFFFVRTNDRAFLLLDARGESVALGDVVPAFGDRRPFQVRGIGWSRDEAWTAIATEGSIFLVATRDHSRLIRLPIGARDVEWR